MLFTALGGDTEAGMLGPWRDRPRVRGHGHAADRRGRVPDHLRRRRAAQGAVRVRVPAAQRALCAELGADIVKTNWPGDGESFARLVEAAAGIPLVLAGGSRLSDRELLQRMEAATAAGGIGCSVGRNIFMHRSPEAITRALSRVIRERWSADKAHEELLATHPAGPEERS